MRYKELEKGSFGVVMLNEDNTISQIGLTEEQHKIFELFLSSLSSKESPLKKLPKEFNLHLNL